MEGNARKARTHPLPRGVAVLAAVAALSTGAIAGVAADATADHWHVNCNGHGLVHGESTNDGSFFSRVDSGPCHNSSRCDLFQYDSVLGYAAAAPGVTCNNWSRNYGNYYECPGNARVELSTRFGYHRHNTHSC